MTQHKYSASLDSFAHGCLLVKEISGIGAITRISFDSYLNNREISDHYDHWRLIIGDYSESKFSSTLLPCNRVHSPIM